MSLLSSPLSQPLAMDDREQDNDVSACEPEPDHAPVAGGAPGLGTEAAASPDFTAPPEHESRRREEIRALNTEAAAKYKAKDYAAAADILAQVVDLAPESAVAHGNLSIALWYGKRLPEAEVHCRRAITLNRDYPPPYKILSELLLKRHDMGGALACYDRMAALEPEFPAAHNNAGLLLRKMGRHEEAEAAFARALALKPYDPRVRFNYLLGRRDEDMMPEAIACCRRALEQQPDNADVVTNLAVCLHLAGQYEEAFPCFERAIALKPDHHEARFNLSLLALLRGDYARGFEEYEKRWHLVEVQKPTFTQPQWQGEPLDGKTILLHAEQGLGDTIQCLRYVPLVAARGGRVIVRLERTLVRLAAGLPDKVVITPTSAPLPAFDVWCAMFSLPRIFGTRLDSIPATTPYLGVRAAIAERWRQRLQNLSGLKVGLVWAGSPRHVNDFRRSIDLARLKPVLDVAGVSFVSLQLGPRGADLAALPAGTIMAPAAELKDFAETAGAILNLDLVIAVDTSVVHLTGALGKPVWMMLPFSPDWRWLLDRADSPWYPTLRLYRQRRPGDWDEVIARVAADLRERVAASADHAALAPATDGSSSRPASTPD
jgi:tetratricopeptide (TPR) repeat protein